MPKRNLTDRTLKALKPAEAGKLYDIMDASRPGFGVRVSDTGRRTFILVSRFPGHTNPTRRAIGTYPATTLEAARAKARDWAELIERGIDPADEEERHRREQELKRANSFAAVAEDFIREKLSGERRGKEVERDIRREFVPVWGKRAISEITDMDVISLIKAKKVSAPSQARNLLGVAKRLFGWAKDQRVYGLKSSQCADIKPSSIVGKKKRRDRILSDQEIFALWRAVGRLKYPYGPVYRLLMLTALRLNEVADASLSEFDPRLVHVLRATERKQQVSDRLRRLPAEHKVWIIPGDRMKGRNEEARAHAVPLTDDMLEIFASLPRFKKGKFLFSTTFGERPAWISDKIKKEIDARMLRTLRALARKRGDDPRTAELKPWVNHDLRRTVRSNLSRLKVTEEAREAVMAHARPGIKGTYDLHDYFDEKREALELWATRLRSIVEHKPEPTDNLISIAAAGT